MFERRKAQRTNRKRSTIFTKGLFPLFGGGARAATQKGKENNGLDKDQRSSKVAAADFASCVSKRRIRLCFTSSAEAGNPEWKSGDSVLKRSTLDILRRRLSAASARSLVPARFYPFLV